MKKICTNIIIWSIFFVGVQAFTSNAATPVTSGVKDVSRIEDIHVGGKPLVIEFYRPACPHCQIMIPRYESVAREYNKGVQFYRVNVDNMDLATGIAKKFSTNDHRITINGVPTFVFIESNGNTSQIIGQMESGALQGKVAKLR